MAYGSGFCDFLKIGGYKDLGAVDKVAQIISLTNGKPMELFDDEGDSSSRIHTPYLEQVFSSMLGKDKGHKAM
jgi:hypothetical protein